MELVNLGESDFRYFFLENLRSFLSSSSKYLFNEYHDVLLPKMSYIGPDMSNRRWF